MDYIVGGDNGRQESPAMIYVGFDTSGTTINRPGPQTQGK